MRWGVGAIACGSEMRTACRSSMPVITPLPLRSHSRATFAIACFDVSSPMRSAARRAARTERRKHWHE